MHKHSIAQYHNTDTSTDLNAAGTIVPWATQDKLDPDYTFASSRFTCKFAGWVKLMCVVHYGTTSVARTSPGIQFFKNAVAFGAVACSAYNRDIPTSEESSNTLIELVEVAVDDIIDVRTLIKGEAGVQAMASSGSSVIILERMS